MKKILLLAVLLTACWGCAYAVDTMQSADVTSLVGHNEPSEEALGSDADVNDANIPEWQKVYLLTKPDEKMPEYCKPFLEDDFYTGAVNAVETELSVDFNSDSQSVDGYKHCYSYISIAEGLKYAPEEVCTLKGYTVLSRTVPGRRPIYTLWDGKREMQLSLTGNSSRVLDIRSSAKCLSVLYCQSYGVLYVQYIYPLALNGKDMSYTYKVNILSAADCKSVLGTLLTDNIYRLEYSDKRIQHWQIKLSENDLQNYPDNMFYIESRGTGIYRQFRSQKRLLWVSDANDPDIYGISKVKRFDNDRRAWNFNGDTSKEPIYTE